MSYVKGSESIEFTCHVWDLTERDKYRLEESKSINIISRFPSKINNDSYIYKVTEYTFINCNIMISEEIPISDGTYRKLYMECYKKNEDVNNNVKIYKYDEDIT